MTATLKSIGDTLKLRRQELNLSLREVENATSIRATHLQAIEEGHLEQLISHIYAQGFVSQYASFLGLNGEEIISHNAHLFVGDAKQEFAYGIGTLEKRGSAGGGVSGIPNLPIVAGFAVVTFIAWLLARYLDVL